MSKARFFFVTNFIVIFMVTGFLTRLFLLITAHKQADTGILALAKLFSIGIFYDFAAVSYYLIVFVVYLIIIPNKIFNSKIHKYIALFIYFLVIYSIIFNAFSECFFWDEFGKRFNFIAVDYLVYTHEVIHNILESYPIPLLLTVIFILTAAVFYYNHKKTALHRKAFSGEPGFKERLKTGAVYLVVPVLFFLFFDKQTLTQSCPNRFNQELAKNGFYSLFSAFRHNELDFYEFYRTLPDHEVFENLRGLLKRENRVFKTKNIYDITQLVTNPKPLRKHNVILIMVESLSASYMGIFGNKEGMTPHLDALAKKSLFFDNLFATGTRTVRGMEAVTLSLPPTPGRSIVKRPDCADLNSAGFIFQKLGYENRFIYAGHGYFDNMNYFFSHNGFEVVDRFDFKDSEVTFSNVWGVCDEDLFAKTIQKADASFAQKKPFFSFVMTTSNHRPFTYPDGKIDIPSHTGRSGGVKYTDYAIDKFLKEAAKKPWFDNTLFVIVADHNGGSAGKRDLPLWRYKIPLYIYAPKIVKPQTVSKLASQIDVIPTILGLIGADYEAKMYGDDILRDDHEERAFIGTYQKLGFYRNDTITILSPDKSVQSFGVKDLKLRSVTYLPHPPSPNDEKETIICYQSASYLYKHNGLHMK